MEIGRWRGERGWRIVSSLYHHTHKIAQNRRFKITKVPLPQRYQIDSQLTIDVRKYLYISLEHDTNDNNTLHHRRCTLNLQLLLTRSPLVYLTPHHSRVCDDAKKF
jgi:hypothetical protein